MIDLDPDPGLAFATVRDAAFRLHRSFNALGLESFPLLSGGKGIHIVVPLEAEVEWDQVREFAKAFCTTLAEADPERFTIALPKKALANDFSLGFMVRLAEKDQRLALRLAEDVGAPTPVGAAVQETLSEAMRSGLAELDMSAVLRLREEQAGVRVRLSESHKPVVA